MHIGIYGKTGIGKTYNSMLWAHEQFYREEVFLCRHLEDMKFYRNEPCIIFDDISFELIEPTQLIKLTDMDFHCSIRILNMIVQIEPTVFKIFTHNNKDAFQPILASPQQHKAICRRIQLEPVDRQEQVYQLLSETYKKFETKLQSRKQLPCGS